MGKTITTYLIDGDPKGTQSVSISNKICQMFVIPRANLTFLNNRTDLQTPAFYILLGEDENTKPKAYIGETENFKDRVKDHDNKKTFWQKALIFISKDATITKADVQYLEYLAISLAKKANNFILNENKQTPKAPNLPENRKDDMDEFFGDITFLTSFIGCNIYDIIEATKQHLFYTNKRGCNATGVYNSAGFTVLKGSHIANDTTPSFNWNKKRCQLIKEYCSTQNGKIILESDKTFSSPSTAAAFCLGCSCNGWTIWTDKDGQTLDTVYRSQIE